MGGLKDGDGLLLDGHDLYVSRNREQVISRVRLSQDWSSGQIAAEKPLAGLRYPAGMAAVGNEVVVAQSQLDKQQDGRPETPFRLTRFSKF